MSLLNIKNDDLETRQYYVMSIINVKTTKKPNIIMNVQLNIILNLQMLFQI